MSYNIDTAYYIKGRLWITRENLLKAGELCDAEGGFPQQMLWGQGASPDLSEAVEVTCPGPWGEGSGMAFSGYLEALALTTGRAEILLIWEGGDSHTGLWVDNGTVREHRVVHALGEEIIR